MRPQSSSLGRNRERGLTLIELMIALVLGLLILAAAIAVFASNRQVYRSTESLGRIQENARAAYEIMARDVREAAGNACEGNLPVVNVINNPTANWYTDFAGGIRGYASATAFPDAAFGAAGSTGGLRVAGTDAVDLKSAVSNGVTIADHQPISASFRVNTNNHGLNPGDVAMVCDFNHAAIFQVTNANPGVNPNIVHNEGNTATPGNSTKCLSMNGVCSSGTIKTYGFGCRNGESPCVAADMWPATIARLRMSRWYVGHNPRGGQSLYQSTIQNTGGVLSVVSNEIVEGVRDMELLYLQQGAANYVDASAVTDWSTVGSVRIRIVMEGQDRVGTDGQVLDRDLIHTVALRNRAP